MMKRSMIVLASTIALTATTGAAVATADGPNDSAALNTATDVAATTVAPATSPLAAPALTVDATATKAFKAFKDLPASPMPANLAAIAGSSGHFGRNPNLARSIKTATGKGWLIPGRGYVCLAVPGTADPASDPSAPAVATTCSPTSVAATDGLQIGVRGPQSDSVAVTTVAPVGSDVVEVTPSGDTKADSTNSDGVSIATVPQSTNVEVVGP